MNTSVQILKFGGTSVGNGERIRRVAQIVAHTANDPVEHFPVVVVSAMAKVTDQLLRIARITCDGDDVATGQELQSLRHKHIEAAEKAITTPALRDDVQAKLIAAFALLERDVATLRTTVEQGCDVSLPTAAVAAWGERLSVLLVAGAVRDMGTSAVPVREEIIITGYPDSQHNPQGEISSGVVIGAEPLSEETRANAHRLIHPVLEQGDVPIVAGFIGHTRDGAVTTLGRNGSDYSATVIGASLDCTTVSIYTDVDGVLTADPRLVMNTRLLPHLSYAEAARLSWFGAKVLHPRTLIPIAHRNIPVRVRNTFHPRLRGTVVGPAGKHAGGAAAITVRRHLALITVESTDLFGAPENAGQVFALAARAGAAPVAICSSSGHHLSFVVEEQAAESVVKQLQQSMDMNAWRVRCREGLAACACIGSGFTADPMSPARAGTALVREHIPIITQGSSEQGITLIVEDSDSERALRCLHRDLIAPVIPLVRHMETRQSKVAR